MTAPRRRVFCFVLFSALISALSTSFEGSLEGNETLSKKQPCFCFVNLVSGFKKEKSFGWEEKYILKVRQTVRVNVYWCQRRPRIIFRTLAAANANQFVPPESRSRREDVFSRSPWPSCIS